MTAIHVHIGRVAKNRGAKLKITGSEEFHLTPSIHKNACGLLKEAANALMTFRVKVAFIPQVMCSEPHRRQKVTAKLMELEQQ